jgi:acyl-coenzyme A thioesterase PaaI-like protein
MRSSSTSAWCEAVATVTEERLSTYTAPDEINPDEDDVGRFDPWIDDLNFRGGGEDYGDLVAEFRRFMNALAVATPPVEEMRNVTRRLADLRATLELYGTKYGGAYSGNRYDLPGRGHPHLVPATITRWTTNEMRATVVFGGAHIGGNGAVHGGMPPLLFDELLGRLANTNRPLRCRTACLRTDYRSVTLPDIEYELHATVDREEGRKRFLSARLTGPDGQVAVTAEALFVALRDGAQ